MHNPIRWIDPSGLTAIDSKKKGTVSPIGMDGKGGFGGGGGSRNTGNTWGPQQPPAPQVVTKPAATVPKPGSVVANNATATLKPPTITSTTQVTTITGNNIPNRHGTPNSVTRLVDSNGKVIQERFFGSDGRAFMDVDFRHPGHHGLQPGQGHIHIWDWSATSPEDMRPYFGPLPSTP